MTGMTCHIEFMYDRNDLSDSYPKTKVSIIYMKFDTLNLIH